MSQIRQTRTFATMAVSPETFDEVHAKLREAEYRHCIHEGPDGIHLDMQGIALTREQRPTYEARLRETTAKSILEYEKAEKNISDEFVKGLYKGELNAYCGALREYNEEGYAGVVFDVAWAKKVLT